MLQNVNKVVLKETILPKEKKVEIVSQFVKFLAGKLGLDSGTPQVVLSYDSGEAASMASFGKYTPETNELRVVAINRNLADILRTIAHEIVHYWQKNDGKLNPASNDTGSAEENEANALAGEFMREFGKNNPMIFE
jgi:Zn-dependent peptidase ImmA (M78 family)